MGRGGGAEDTGEAGTGTIILMVSTISLRAPSVQCSTVQCREGGEAIMLSASICRGEEAEMAGTPGHWHQSSADGDGDTSIAQCHVTGDE